ncbi:enoyl-CoA hydratase [Williamsia limnetica]|uniref:Enoyl-CoA hydratase n=1 Tax=Williamsia limnetica TaxID=882452 RepID=A0A318RMI3_WILLI|nr:enoyl-CoA hydratase-related protein [Williamsia limnetica]PYE12440.1 enoyl-CoA hydratase [Williamsia limnetica]
MVDNPADDTADGDVRLDLSDHVATITIDRPSAHNALTVDMIRTLAAAIDSVRGDDEVRAVIVTGAGDKAFSAGGDLGELIPRLTAGELEVLIPDASKRFFSDVYKPIIAAVNGFCLAGGLEILLGTDLRIAADHATFGLPEVHWGVIPGGGSHVRLPQQLAWPQAMHLLLAAESIDAAEALRIGLINEVVAPDEVMPRARELAQKIAAHAPVAVQTAKEIAVKALGNEPRFNLETALNERVLATRDAREGPRAFIEKRQPRYEGK